MNENNGIVKGRKISNKDNIVKIIVSIIFIIVFTLGIVISTIEEPRWLTGFKTHISPVLIDLVTKEGIRRICVTGLVISIVLTTGFIAGFVNNVKANKEILLAPYGFDYELEYGIYKLIGEKKLRSKEKVFLKKNYAKRYKLYTFWKYDKEEQYSQYKYSEDFFRYLNKIYRIRKVYVESIKALLIPSVLAIIPISNFVGGYAGFIFSLGIFLLLVITMAIEYRNAASEMHFMKDFIEVFFSGRTPG